MTKLGHFLEGRLDRVRPEALLRVGISPVAKVLDLKGRLRCRGCGRKGRAVVSVKWAGLAQIETRLAGFYVGAF